MSEETGREMYEAITSHLPRWRVYGWAAWVWDCDCPDCATGSHQEDPIAVDMTVAAESLNEAIIIVEERVCDVNKWDDLEWTEGPDVAAVK